MYRCEICRAIAPAGQHLIRHAVKKSWPNERDIARELQVCADCDRELKSGVPLKAVAAEARKSLPAPPPPPMPEEGPEPLPTPLRPERLTLMALMESPAQDHHSNR